MENHQTIRDVSSSVDIVPVLLGDQFSMAFWGFLLASKDILIEKKEKKNEKKKLHQFNLPKPYIFS